MKHAMDHARAADPFAGAPPVGRGKRSRGEWFAAAAGEPDERDDERPRRSRHRRHGFDPGFPGGPGGPGPRGPRGGWGPPGGPWGPPPRGRRDRGDVRAAVLLLLAEKPRHGYEIITELTDRSDGRWRPSPGSVYPVLKRLARDGLVSSDHAEGRRVFALTPQGEELVATQRESWGEPWAQPDAGPDVTADLWSEGRTLAGATWQVAQSGDPALVEQAAGILTEARKQIYRLLADA